MSRTVSRKQVKKLAAGRPLRAIITHPNHDGNCGDLITYYGTKALLTKALGGSQYLDVVQWDEGRAHRELETYTSQFCWGEDIDIIALAGSPWLWHNCHEQSKYRILSDAVKRWPGAKKVALGLGSCFPRNACEYFDLGDFEHFWGESIPEVKRLFGQFDYILTRDKLAEDLFDQAGIKARYTYDTSLYSSHIIGKRENKGNKKVLFFYDPSKGVSLEALPFRIDDYIDYQLQWAKDNNADIYCNSPGDKERLLERGIQGSFSVDLSFLSSKLVEYDEMLTGRVHMGVLGYLSGIPNITLLPVDSRFMTVLKAGINIHFIGDFFPYETIDAAKDIWADVQKEEARIVQELKAALEV
jgi:hypothetical protein